MDAGADLGPSPGQLRAVVGHSIILGQTVTALSSPGGYCTVYCSLYLYTVYSLTFICTIMYPLDLFQKRKFFLKGSGNLGILDRMFFFNLDS